MGIAGIIAAFRGGPGTGAEAATEAVLPVVTLVVVGEEPATFSWKGTGAGRCVGPFSKREAFKYIEKNCFRYLANPLTAASDLQ